MSRIAALLAIVLCGCALVNDAPPSVDVLDVRLIGLGLSEQRLALTVCVTNPNPDQIAFQRVTAALDVSGAPLVAGATDLSISVPAHASSMVPFTVVTTTRNLGAQLLGIVRTGSVDYRVHGVVTFRGPLGLSLPYSREGRLDPLAGGLGLASAATGPSPTRCA